MSDRKTGVVKFYNRGKEYGFLTGDDGQDIFVHISALKEAQLAPADLDAGVRVEFTPADGRDGKGQRATGLKLV